MIKPEKSGGVELFLRQTDNNKTSRAAGTVPLSDCDLNRNEIIDEWAMHRALAPLPAIAEGFHPMCIKTIVKLRHCLTLRLLDKLDYL
jgi:hypothetical protein